MGGPWDQARSVLRRNRAGASAWNSDIKRINSHICSIAYPILEQAGALSRTRLRENIAVVGAVAVAPGSQPSQGHA
jgi:hypothetical protein